MEGAALGLVRRLMRCRPRRSLYESILSSQEGKAGEALGLVPATAAAALAVSFTGDIFWEHARSMLGSYVGGAVKQQTGVSLDPEKAEGLSPELQRALEPLLATIEELSERIVEYNDRIEALAQASSSGRSARSRHGAPTSGSIS